MFQQKVSVLEEVVRANSADMQVHSPHLLGLLCNVPISVTSSLQLHQLMLVQQMTVGKL